MSVSFGRKNTKVGFFVDSDLVQKVDNANENILGIGVNVLYPPPPFQHVSNDGSDVTSALQAIITNMSGSTIVLPDGDYGISSTLDCPDNTTLILAYRARLFTTKFLDNILQCKGSVTGTTALSADLPMGSRDGIGVTDASIFSVGDLIMIRDNYRPETNQPTRGEMHYIHAVDASSNTIDIEEPTWDTYQVSQSACIDLITPKQNFRIFGGIFEGLGVGGNQYSGLLIQNVVNFRIVQAKVRKWARRGISVSGSLFGKIDHCYFEDIYDTNPNNNPTGYAIEFSCGTQWSDVVYCSAIRVSKLWDASGSGSGFSRFCNVEHNKVYGANRGGISTHAAASHININDNDIYGSRLAEMGEGHGIFVRGANMTITNNRIYSPAEYGIECQSNGSIGSYNISGNKIYNAGQVGIRVAQRDAETLTIANRIHDINIQDNEVDLCGQDGILVYAFTDTNGAMSNINVHGNTVKHQGTYGIRVAMSTGEIDDGAISDNIVQFVGDSTAGTASIALKPNAGKNISGFLVQGNRCLGSETGILSSDSTHVVGSYVNNNLIKAKVAGVSGFDASQVGTNPTTIA
ncbi:right-handed parallel beta-helix repeat-containing protein [Pullulanibacillus sp. KACC 23026]|uniref:right-handed parallel beta-helix repeat-containing protein n=1 Tax=Pullulanibacillus sp. KACC 23026 TaxID=3028315 RepID=UPI0023AFD69E|nr:right-handed parallel beta-helix repeat-containing protein [Pullulanibacillus sp. KACC 23026]WEG14161.1 right-handed parallel beta-helix repeat-containing protein [Pullulanibacillus sp. KACC 23026]